MPRFAIVDPAPLLRSCASFHQAKLNFPRQKYAELLPHLATVSLDELVRTPSHADPRIPRRSAGSAAPLPNAPPTRAHWQVMSVRRQSNGFARGSSAFRGVTAHPSGRWEARLGGVPGGPVRPSSGRAPHHPTLVRSAWTPPALTRCGHTRRTHAQSGHTYLGLFDDEREAARAFDRALVALKGASAATNFPAREWVHLLIPCLSHAGNRRP